MVSKCGAISTFQGSQIQDDSGLGGGLEGLGFTEWLGVSLRAKCIEDNFRKVQ